MRKVLIGCLISFMFIFESVFLELLPTDPFGKNWIFVPYFLLITILFFSVYGNRNVGVIYGFVFGLLFDIVYTEILGIYFFTFPFIIYIFNKLMKIFHSNIVVVSVMNLLAVSALEMIVYQMIKVINLTTIDFASFLHLRLLPSLGLNLIFIIIVAYPYKRLFEKYAAELKE
ncbi:rod shape-determining protein MreD [Niallia circulans]|jgi:rod shape-determining protein MreD|uniref:Rod shape-determining protein MreD n=3 Tax=Niallia circulans TaxID=1397 RepID=A0A0J1IEZ8_NIACI|nr:rod shape-determining protein MreD [Niallia circulans]KLV24518.1 rod shape-determining protein MreD [Niallia circulans]MDR4317759.1 rod shape-determining protein MreD [Niallia circulans]MED3841542.1 rod shape-determining protein MreD [Niallia circulans]MED4243278.1 rod shape-determining protein MreD [Niallia circulans]MED4248417.1 rod shape-determining protein MreD [Niallia circulans]